MRILIADSFPETALAAIETAGDRCEYRPRITAEELPEATTGSACTRRPGGTRSTPGPTT